MKARYINTYFIFCLVLSIVSTSCNKSITIDPPIDRLQTQLVFSSDKTAEASVTGLYRKMVEQQNNFGSYPISLYAGLSADELYSTSPNSQRDEFQSNNILITSGVIANNFWTRAYGYIYHSNACIEGLVSSVSLTQGLKNQLLGEMKFIRALHYFYLVNFFGDVPLVLSTDYRLNASLPRASSENIYQQIINDLNDASNLLPTAYASAGKARPNRWAVVALLARVQLYRNNWAEAEANSTALISSGTYSLVRNLDSVFLNNNKEAVWQLYPIATPAFAVLEATNFIPTSTTARPNISITDSLANAFETNTDKRKIGWVIRRVVGGVPYYIANKYKIRTNNTTESITVFRLAEQYLVRAEARVQRNNLTGAIMDINIIRERAGLPLLPVTLTIQQVFQAIEKERRLELLAEWGHRWLDLKRTNRIEQVLSAYKGANWQNTDVLYPIPYEQILLNNMLTQNHGY